MTIKDQIVFEDNHLIIVNKKAGQLVQGDKTGDTSMDTVLKAYIKKKYNKPGAVFLGVCHRLDRPTSGLVIFARTSKALTRINNLIKFRKIRKEYLAIVAGRVEKERTKLVDHLKKNERQNKSYVVDENKNGAKQAILRYEKIYEFDKYKLLKINLETGRHHQIRAQLSNQKIFIKGDVKYGARRPNKDASISLHAYQLQFIHPVSKQEINLKAMPITKDSLWKTIANKSF